MNTNEQTELHNALLDAMLAFGRKHGDNFNAADFLGVLEALKFHVATSAYEAGVEAGVKKRAQKSTEGMFQ